MTFKLDDEFKARNRKHTLQERINLEELIKAEGCIEDALTVAIIADGEHVLCDGYTTHGICEANDIPLTKPRYVNLPSREAVLAWIDKRQKGRRNLTAEEMADNRAKRIERVAEARAEGQSVRTIAENEGVSKSTIQEDIKEATVQGWTVETPNGKVVGNDGRERPSTSTKLCDNCKHRKEMKRPLVADCPDCKELRKKKPKASPTPEKPPEPELDEKPWVDDWGIPITKDAAEAFRSQEKFDELLDVLKKARTLYRDLAEGPGGEFLQSRSMNVSHKWHHSGLDTCILNVKDSRPKYTVCPYAYAPNHKHDKKCNLCYGLGWTVAISKTAACPEEFINAAKTAHGIEIIRF